MGAYSKVPKGRETTDGGVTPGTSALTKLSPERATEYITCLISNCFYLCRPFGTFHVVAQLPGVNTPVCGLSRHRRFSPDSNILAISPSQTLDGCTTSLSYFMGNLFAGVDFYVWKNLYLGAECGFGLKTGKSPNTYYCDDDYSANYDATGVLTSSIKRTFDGETNTTTTVTSTPSNTSTDTTNGPKTSNETSETSFKLFVEPAVRIGWKF